jgi:hypothetical protein
MFCGFAAAVHVFRGVAPYRQVVCPGNDASFFSNVDALPRIVLSLTKTKRLIRAHQSKFVISLKECL